MKLTIKQVQRLCGIEQTMCASWLSEAKAMKHFLRSGSDPVTSSASEPRRRERRKSPPCPQCDGADAERHRRAVSDGFDV